jgi:dihydroorotate dehydrogenase electron transfer subunit
MRMTGAELTDRREILPGTWRLAWHAPAIVAGIRAGQYVHARTIETGGLPLRRPYPVATADPASGVLTIEVPGAAAGAARAWAASLRAGDRADLLGPLGRPFEVDPRSRHLLLVADGASIAALRLLADEAIRDARSVVLLYGAPSAGTVYPSSLLPDEVEYVVATADGSLGHRGPVDELVVDYEAWADQAFAAGPPALLAAVARLAAGRRDRLGVATLGRKRGGGRPPAPGSPEARRRSFLQVAIGQSVGCAAGTCGGCAVAGTEGTVRVCREGPAFAAGELDWGLD